MIWGEAYLGTFIAGQGAAEVAKQYEGKLGGAEIPFLGAALGNAQRDGLITAGDAQIGWANINVDWIGSGCDGHPTVATHMGMGVRFTEELQTRLGW